MFNFLMIAQPDMLVYLSDEKHTWYSKSDNDLIKYGLAEETFF